MGGIIILFGVLVFLLAQSILYKPISSALYIFVKLLIGLFPLLILSILEDFHITTRPKYRLIATIICGVFVYYLQASHTLAFDRHSFFLSKGPIFTIFSITMIILIIQATNLIDGANGILLINSLCIFLVLTLVSLHLKEAHIVYLSIAGLVATSSFLLWNYPFGLLFCGDTGAYFLGGFSCMNALFLYLSKSGISAFFVIALFSYPLYEISFTVIRRLYCNKPLFIADNCHLHHLLFSYLERYNQNSSMKKLNNALAPIIISLQIPIFIVCFFHARNPIILMSGFLITYSMYVMLYRYLLQSNTNHPLCQ